MVSPSWNSTEFRCTVIHPAWGFMAFLYCLVIYLVSSTSGILPAKPVFPGEDKLGHLLAYAGLTFIVSMGMRDARVRASLATRLTAPIVFAASYGLLDVLHQRNVPGRTGDVRDWLANVAGAILAQAIIYGYAYYFFKKHQHIAAHSFSESPVRPLPPLLKHAHWAVSGQLQGKERLKALPLPFRREKLRDDSKWRARVLSTQECKRLLSACKVSRDLMLYDIVIVALCTGLRREELLGLRWDHVDFETGSLVVETDEDQKHARRTVPMVGPALRCILVRAKDRRPETEYVFGAPNRTGRPIRPDNIQNSWKEALKRSGMGNYSFRDLRQTTTFYLAKSGASPEEIAEILGRSDHEEQLSLEEKKTIFKRMVDMFFVSQTNLETKG